MTPTVVTIYVRHSKDCKRKGDEFERRCRCRKHLRWTHNGKRYRRKADTRSWAEAEQIKRTLEDQLSGRVTSEHAADRLISDAVDLFLQDKTAQGVTPGVLKKYKLELARLRDFCEGSGVLIVRGMTRELLTRYCATWESYYPSSTTRSKVRERLRSFLRYCYEAQWLERIPALPKINVEEPPTLPLTDEEYKRLLDALHITNPRRWDGKISTQGLTPKTHARVRGLIQLMRWSGLAIRDALSLEVTALQWDEARQLHRVVTARQKTGTHVSVPLPPDVAAELVALSAKHARYVFFEESDPDFYDLARTYTSRYIRPAFEAAKIPCDGHMVSHRLRDTFAVDLLQKGVPLEEVSRLMGHESIRTTEKSYARWVKARQDRLDELVTATWEGK